VIASPLERFENDAAAFVERIRGQMTPEEIERISAESARDLSPR
jgi:hypothetical protein